MKYFLSLLFTISLIGLISCGDDDGNGGGTDPVTEANIIGEVNLYDDGESQIDASDMTVTIDGTSFSAVTDAEGKYTLMDVPFGTYNLTYEKAGYGTFKIFDLSHTNTGSSTVISPNPSLGQVSTTQITNLTTNTSGTTVTVGATTDPEANNANTRYIRFFFSTQADVSSENYDAVLETFPAQITPYNLNLNPESLEALGFSSGQTVYVKCYGESFWSNQYEDPTLDRTVFPNLNENSADAVSFVVP